MKKDIVFIVKYVVLPFPVFLILFGWLTGIYFYIQLYSALSLTGFLAILILLIFSRNRKALIAESIKFFVASLVFLSIMFIFYPEHEKRYFILMLSVFLVAALMCLIFFKYF